MKDKKRILGYFNPTMSYPSTLVIISELGSEIFLTYPNCSSVKFDGELPEKNFVREPTEKYLGDNEFAYGVSESEIYVGGSDRILKSLSYALKKSKLSNSCKKAIKSFIED